MKNKLFLLLLAWLITGFGLSVERSSAQTKSRALIVDGQNNHKVWPKTTQMMKGYLEETGLFDVDVATTAPNGTDADFQPAFSEYDVVISNYNGAAWPEKTQQSFVDYMNQGGGLVVVHAADNAFSNWKEYNQMIGLGGWGGRTEKSGPYVYYSEDGKVIRDTSDGRGGGHGRQHEFPVVTRNSEHPITQGLPSEWMHAQDELYDKLRGPAQGMVVLATSFSDKETGGSGRHEPMLMVIDFGKGRVFHTTLGHADYSMECVGFITTFNRGCEWAATGKVTQPIPQDFPGPDKTSKRTNATK
ncbi:MAG: ThuA domain-containing protein [Planctomycetota bacterium]|nr:ThuA domain-containing protein [Planctomycetota bacterium]